MGFWRTCARRLRRGRRSAENAAGGKGGVRRDARALRGGSAGAARRHGRRAALLCAQAQLSRQCPQFPHPDGRTRDRRIENDAFLDIPCPPGIHSLHIRLDRMTSAVINLEGGAGPALLFRHRLYDGGRPALYPYPDTAAKEEQP